METPTLTALARVGTYPDDAGNVRLYHATSKESADAIVRDQKLIASPPTDPAELALLRAHGYGGHIYLASSPTIRDDLPGSEVVVAVDVPATALPHAPLRDAWGDPLRVELEFKAPLDANQNTLKLSVARAERVDRDAEQPAREGRFRRFLSSVLGVRLR